MATPELLTVREVAQICRVHEVTIRRHIRQGLLRSVRVGRAVRIRREDLDGYVECATGDESARPRALSSVSSDIDTATPNPIEPAASDDELRADIDRSIRAHRTARTNPRRGKPLQPDDPLFELFGTIHDETAPWVSSDKYRALADQ